MTADERPAPPGLHLILGDSAGGIFVRNYGRENLLIDRDVLNCGPTRRCDSYEAWKAMRLQYWFNLIPGDTTPHPPTHSVADDPARLRDADLINIWAATSLSEQLFIAFVVHVIDTLGIDPSRLLLLQFENLRGRRARILGMGELNEEHLADHPAPMPMPAAMLDDYRAAWNALTSPDPLCFERFENERPSANAWLKQAMTLMLRRFPNHTDGLLHWDRVLLECVREHAPRAARVIGHAMTRDWDDADLTGDSFLFARLLRLGDESLPKPPLHLSGDRTDMRKMQVTLTPFGADVLEGRASNYPANPIEEWAAGVKLSSKTGELWFNEGGKLRAAPTT